MKRPIRYLVSVSAVDHSNPKGPRTHSRYATCGSEALGRALAPNMAAELKRRTGLDVEAVKVERKKYPKVRVPKGPRARPSVDGQAREYAQWLAARDGVELAEGRVAIHWSGVDTLAGKFEKRPRAVTFGNVSILLPNWDWQPVMTEETIRDAPRMVNVEHGPGGPIRLREPILVF
jgi:hypothetical protein